MKHLTHVGYWAGKPICGAVRQPEDTGEHYGIADERYKREHEAGTLCDGCYKEHLAVIADEP